MAGAVVAASALCAAAALVGAVAALGLSAGPGGSDESLQASGSIIYTWYGDPARRCAAVGVCGVRGALIIEAQGPADAQGEGRQLIINLGGGSSTVRVLTGTGQSAAECVDTTPNGGGEAVFVARTAGGRLAATVQPPVSSGRCAGPLARDLAGLRLAVRRTGGRRPSFDLRGSQSFAAGPFSGSLVSTLVLRPSPAGGGGASSSSSASGPGGPARRKVLIERVSLRYVVTSLPGSLEISFAGEPDPFCAGLDTCGTTGTLSLSPAPLRGTLTLTASRTVRRRVSARQAIADFRAGRLGNPFGFLATRGVGITVSETYDAADGSRCQDSSSRSQSALFVGGPRRSGGVQVGLSEPGNSGSLLRTHCPGPSDMDVVGSQGTFARGVISRADLLAARSAVYLSKPGSFSGVGYVGSRSGAIGLSLALQRVHAGTVQGRQP